MNKKRGLVLVVLALITLVSYSNLFSAETGGCYVYPQASEDLYCVGGTLDIDAEADCAFYDSCNMDEFFIPASDCSELDECEEITCSADCQLHAKGICTELGGEEVSEEEYNLWCTPGCCKISDKFCSFNLFKEQCNQQAQNFGVTDPSLIIFNNPTGMTNTQCIEQYCQGEVKKAELTIYVNDSEGNPLSNVEIVLEGTSITGTTASDGKFKFTNINAIAYTVATSLEGYSSGTLVVTLSPEEQAEYHITIQKLEGIAEIKGVIKDTSGQAISQPTISWSGTSSGTLIADENGEYNILQLPKGDFLLTASKIGYKSQEKLFTITTAGIFPLNFELEPTESLGISGQVFLDSNNNKEWDSSDELVFGASIYLDSNFKGYSKYPDGDFMIEVEVTAESGKEALNISATYQNYNFEDTFIIEEGESLTGQKILLTTYVGECTEPDTEKIVEEFTVTHVLGKAELKLTWTKPCPEVIGYEIEKYYLGEKVESLHASPAENFVLDSDLEWDNEYSYKIIAHYDKGRLTINDNEISVNVGDKRCQDRYRGEIAGWDTFCLIGSKEQRKTIWTCDEFNKLQPSSNCAEKDGTNEDYYCSQVSETSAICSNAGGCGLVPQSADPFGLYYSREECYGTTAPESGAENFCYFDFTDTIVNECNDCTTISSCFDYKSKDACEIDNCLYGGTKCSWVAGAADSPLVDYSLINLPTLVTEETGAGYCVEDDYQSDDLCSLCGPNSPPSTLFENFFCTAEICSGLGQCFSAFDLDLCTSCGEHPTPDNNCYAYNTELECVSDQKIEKDNYGKITSSEDRCGWGKCLWLGTGNGFSKNGCVKDGNADGNSDCEVFFAAGEQQNCKIDNSAPKTTILPEGINIISGQTPEITFQGDDSFHAHGGQKNTLFKVSYCLTNTLTDNCFDQGVEEAFITAFYPGKTDSESLIVDLMNSSFLLGKKIKGETYKLKYYSEDKFFNRENVQETFIFIDNVAPEFTINENIETVEDVSSLFVYLSGTNEIMECTLALKQIFPAGETNSFTVPREEQIKEATFDNLQGVKYNLNVTCVDEVGNVNSEIKEYVFDLEERIDIIYPAPNSAVAESEISFQVNTVAGASCSLYLAANNEKVADFSSDETGKIHQTEPITGFFQQDYIGTHKAVCSELLDETQTYEDYFDFKVDFTPPVTQIILTEGVREEKPTIANWEEYFIENVAVNFECLAEGFECDKIYYCLGEDCLNVNENYQEYSSTVELTESTQICYYSKDLADNPVYTPVCGTIKIEGYGIILQKPTLHYYLDEQWGISNEEVFDLQFFTRVPTEECRFDFSPAFDYNNTPLHKVRQINSEGNYLFEDFPESVFTEYSGSCSGGDCVKTIYVKCKDLNGIIGPEQKIYLEYDPTAPNIIDAYAQPDDISEGITTDLFVETDDKTLCKYSDNSESDGSEDYSLMEYSFPGLEDSLLNIIHQSEFNINFEGPSKQYSLYTQCQNGAGDLSETDEILFDVDYSQLGYIIEGSLKPSGYVWGNNVTLEVETSKNAYCQYDFDGLGYASFVNGENSLVHSTPITVSEGLYSIPIKCSMADHTVSSIIEFTVDLSSPIITQIEDGNNTCGSNINLIINTDDLSISQYAYEVYNQGKKAKTSTSSSSLASNGYFNYGNYGYGIDDETEEENDEEDQEEDTTAIGALVLSGESNSEMPLVISVDDLNEGNTYTIKVKAIDSAGNEGEWQESDGVNVLDDDDPACFETDPPVVSFNIDDNSSCQETYVEMSCTDSSTCQEFLYGKSSTSSKCIANQTYNGQKITFSKSGVICYYVEDSQGANHSDKKTITFTDGDGDEIRNSCDECKQTEAGKIVNDKGCSEGGLSDNDKSLDSDEDGLPDKWEKIYDGFACPLNYLNPDSDDDGETDNNEDYDNDGYSNYEEYLGLSNPCLADDAPSDTGKVDDGDDTGLPGQDLPPADLPDDEVDILAWIFLILGLLMVIGGTAYLIYYYLYSPAAKTVQKKPALTSGPGRAYPGTAGRTKKNFLSNWKSKLTELNKARQEKAKIRKREQVFEEFGKDSENIPHLEKILKKKSSHLMKVKELAQKYSDHKEDIAPGLKREEKTIFNKLENIAKKSETKPIPQVVSNKEAKDIFKELKDISKKRKSNNKSKK